MSDYLSFPDDFNFGPRKEEPQEVSPEQPNRDTDPTTWFVQEITTARAELKKWSDALIESQLTDTIPEGMTWHTNLQASATNISYMLASILQEKGYGAVILPGSLGPERYRHVSDSSLSIYVDGRAFSLLEMARLDESFNAQVLRAAISGDLHAVFTSEAIKQGVWTGDEIPKSSFSDNAWWEHAGLDVVSRAFMTSLVLGQHHDLKRMVQTTPTTMNIYIAMHRKGFRPFNPEALYGMAEAKIDSAISRYSY